MKLFGTDGIRGKANKFPVTPEVVLKLGKAAAKILTKDRKPLFLIGKDTRASCYMLENSLTAGLVSMGADVLLVGPIPTPGVAHLVKSFTADAGIMITASHNHYDDNGIKFFDSNGYKLSDEIEEKIEKLVLNDELNSDHIDSGKIGRAKRIDDAQGRYVEFAKESINNTSLSGLKIVLDCANGASYKVAPLILEELGSNLITINNNPTGININFKSGVLHPEITRDSVLKHGADLGIILDGDADRIVLIDEKGNILDGDYIMAISWNHFLEKNMLKNNKIVVTDYTNLAFDDLIKKEGGEVIRVKNGDKYVIERMIKEKCSIGGESSGHIIFSDYCSTGDGIIAGLQILRIMKEKKKKLSELTNILKKYPQIIVNVDVKEKKPLEKMPKVQEEIRKAEEELKENGRHLIRYSGTEMKARVMFEGSDEELITKLANKIAIAIKEEVG